MLGPITSEIARINREKLLIERLKKIQEIETLYVKPDIQVPIQEQLKKKLHLRERNKLWQHTKLKKLKFVQYTIG